MAAIINKKELKHIASLARLDLTEREEEKLLKDLQNILGYFNELQILDVSDFLPMTGGTSLKNIFREDDSSKNTNLSSGVHAFPETEGGYLKIPPVFE